jgi:hypothetical protein
MSVGESSYDRSPVWLPGGRRGESARAWWRDLARAVEAVRERYPRALADLPAKWWRAADMAEQLAAVCAWRLDLDGGRGADPREELEFHEALERLRERLEHRARSDLLERAPRAVATDGPDVWDEALEADLRTLTDDPDVPLEEAFFAPRAGRPGFGLSGDKWTS